MTKSELLTKLLVIYGILALDNLEKEDIDKVRDRMKKLIQKIEPRYRGIKR